MKDRTELVKRSRKRLARLKHLHQRARQGRLTPAQTRELDRLEPEHELLKFLSNEYPIVFGLEEPPKHPTSPPLLPYHTWKGTRQRLFDIYGQRCACCGETNPQFLTLDHVNEDGQEHWAQHKGNRLKMMHDAIERPDEARFQILCYNCNIGKFKNFGLCPHKGVRKRWPKVKK